MSDDDLLFEEIQAGTDRERQLVELVRLDYDATLRALNGFMTTGSQLRGIGVAAWGVVLGHPLRARPYPVFRAGYPLLVISAVLAAIVFAV
jgi:hypothetical protein